MKKALIGIAALAVLAAAAAAQPPPAPTEPEIVVRAQQERALHDFVAALTEAGRSDQVARWDQEICPAVLGIDPGQADFVALRIGNIAASLGLGTRPSGCRTTMLIVVTNDASGLATRFARAYPVTLRTDGRARLNLFAATTRPVRWLSVTDLCGYGCVLPNSRIVRATHPQFQAMIVIVDARQIGGFGLGELSDYVAMVALANPRLTAIREPESILSMFERRRPEGGRFALTGNDRAFLSGLYRSNPNLSAQSQRGSIERHMRNDSGQ